MTDPAWRPDHEAARVPGPGGSVHEIQRSGEADDYQTAYDQSFAAIEDLLAAYPGWRLKSANVYRHIGIIAASVGEYGWSITVSVPAPDQPARSAGRYT